MQNISKTAEGCASALTSPIRWCSVNCLHKRVRLSMTTTHCRCILDEIKMKLCSRKISEMARHSSINIYGTTLDDSQGVE